MFTPGIRVFLKIFQRKKNEVYAFSCVIMSIKFHTEQTFKHTLLVDITFCIFHC